ncbi:MAG: pantoate--beta-alanine ligase, partial [Chitinophagaceae bacterium]|nr:pantoate--beta-alanine ligase [Chitinophagaceae bacterium]
MIIFKKTCQLHHFLQQQKQQKKRIGFAPTMGALHEGHLSLIKRCKTQNDVTVCSIFINPLQFNNAQDLQMYPKTIENDIEQLVLSYCDVLFYPLADEVYPPGYSGKQYDLGKIETILEGKFRLGHFQGVCQVMDRLLHIVEPGTLYLGQKDYQQCLVIKKLVQLLGKENEIKLNFVETKREPDG